MASEHVQSVFEDACDRLFALHADGFERPRPALQPVSSRASALARADAIAPVRRTSSLPRARSASLF